jgi:hypothetical protein
MGILAGKAIIVTAPVGIGHATSLVLLAESAPVSNHKLAVQVQGKIREHDDAQQRTELTDT